MIKIQNQQPAAPATIIRTASERELSNYEKNKLAEIEERAQQNRLEAIRLNGNRLPIDSETKAVNIKVGDLAFKSIVTPKELDTNELFFIRCSLN